MAEIDNLRVQQDINKLLNERRSVLAAQTRELQTQLQISLQIKSVVDGLSPDDLVERLNNAQKALDAISQSAKNASDTSSQAMEAISTGAASAAMGTGKLEKQTKLLLARYPALKTVGTAALTGLSQGFTNLLALGRGVVGVVESLVSGIFNVGKSILAIPLKIFKGLLDAAADFPVDTRLAQAFENIRKEFGSFKEDVSKNVIESARSMQGELANTGLSSFRVFGMLADKLDYFRKVAEGAGAEIHNFGTEIAKNAEVVGAFAKGLGVAENDFKGMMDRATTLGTTLTEQFRETANYSLQLGKAFGISQKVIAKDINMMVKDVAHFGGTTKKEMAEASIYFRKLGVEVSKTSALMDKLDSFSAAAESAAQLSQAFGTSVDAFKLMQAQSPAEKMDILRKALSAAGKTTENMSYQEKKLLAQTVGLDEATTSLAFSAKNQGLSLDEIKKKSGEAEKKQISQTEALSKLADSIERMVMQGQKLKGSFFDMFIHGFELGVKNSWPFLKLMRNLRMDLVNTMLAGREVGAMFVNLFPGFKGFLDNMSKFFDPHLFNGLLNGVVKSFKNFFQQMQNGKYSPEKLIESLQKNFFDYFNQNKTAGKGILEAAKTSLTALAGIIGEGAKYVIQKLTSGLSFLSDFIANPAETLKKLQAGGGAGGAAAEIFKPLFDALNDRALWTNLLGAVTKLFRVVFKKAKEFFTGSEFRAIVKDFWPVIATVVFGPALSRMLASVLIESIAKSFMSGKATGVLVRVGKSLASKLGSGVGGEALGAAAGPAAFIAAAAAVGRGVSKYTDTITSTLDRSSKVIAAGATGVIDALTLGLLPDDMTAMIANTLATVVDKIYDGIKSAFGTGFGESLKRQFAAQFEVLGSAWDFINSFFVGDQASFDRAQEELQAAVSRFAVSSLEYLLFQLPNLLERISLRLLAGISGMVVKAVSSAFEIIAKGIDKYFGSNFAEKVRKASDEIRSGITAMSDNAAKTLEKESNKVSEMSGKFQDKYLRTAADQAKQAAAKSAATLPNATGDATAKAVKDMSKKSEASLDDVARNIKTVKDVQKELDAKNFDLPGAIKAIKDKLSGISFDFISPDQVQKLDSSAKNVNQLAGLFENLHSTFEFLSKSQTASAKNDSIKKSFEAVSANLRSFSEGGGLSEFTKSLDAITKDVNEKSVTPSIKAVQEIIQSVNDLNAALASGDAAKIAVSTNLKKFVGNVGLGNKGTYTIQNKGIQMTINMEVKMNAAEVEEVLIMRKQSIIKDGIVDAPSLKETDRAKLGTFR